MPFPLWGKNERRRYKEKRSKGDINKMMEKLNREVLGECLLPAANTRHCSPAGVRQSRQDPRSPTLSHCHPPPGDCGHRTRG